MPRRPRFHKPPSASVSDARQAESKAERDRFYSGSTWRRVRATFLDEHPTCVDCEAAGLLTEATIPHHLEERLARPDLAYSWDNLVALCSPCHTARHKTIRPVPPGG